MRQVYEKNQRQDRELDIRDLKLYMLYRYVLYKTPLELRANKLSYKRCTIHYNTNQYTLLNAKRPQFR